jgi:hypothetical protein
MRNTKDLKTNKPRRKKYKTAQNKSSSYEGKATAKEKEKKKERRKKIKITREISD